MKVDSKQYQDEQHLRLLHQHYIYDCCHASHSVNTALHLAENETTFMHFFKIKLQTARSFYLYPSHYFHFANFRDSSCRQKADLETLIHYTTITENLKKSQPHDQANHHSSKSTSIKFDLVDIIAHSSHSRLQFCTEATILLRASTVTRIFSSMSLEVKQSCLD